jgi:hypothetical protein
VEAIIDPILRAFLVWLSYRMPACKAINKRILSSMNVHPLGLENHDFSRGMKAVDFEPKKNYTK